MSTYQGSRRAGLSFGDVCEAEFLYDVHVREDARALLRDEAPASFSKKKWGVDEAVSYFVPGLAPKQGDSFALAHGWHRRSICLSDDCLILSALGRGGRDPGGRILFAPVVECSGDYLAKLEEAPTYGRFPLPGDSVHTSHAIVELRCCFMVDARSVHTALPDLVVLSTADETRQELADRWTAYSARRGPFVVEDNLEKFAELLVDSGFDEDEVIRLADSLGRVAGAAWAYEGGGLEAAGVAGDESSAPGPVLSELEQQLEVLAGHASDALAAVRACPR